MNKISSAFGILEVEHVYKFVELHSEIATRLGLVEEERFLIS